MADLNSLLTALYKDPSAVEAGLRACMEQYSSVIQAPKDLLEAALKQRAYAGLDQSTNFLIAYPDHIQGDDKTPLQYLHQFVEEYLSDIISGVHLLPFCPYSSDEGYSVIDYRSINPEAGTWDDVCAIASEYQLMADMVVNHCSVQHTWFQNFLAAKEPYTQYFTAVDPDTDLSQVARPRTHPVLTAFETAQGTKHVWTTFSADQVDINFADPAVLIEFVDIMLFYAKQGARVIRLDAIAYLWKEIGTSCIHLPQTHAVVKLLRAILDEVAPWVVLITETNVPHKENVSYFGNADEADMIYQFSLPPLVLDASIREDTRHLQDWAQSLPEPSAEYGFFNFLASHDGTGMLPAHGILSDKEISNLIKTVEMRGGKISYKSTPNGKIPYELNINYLSAVSASTLPPEARAQRFIICQAVLLALAGVPGIYLHSLIGSENWEEGLAVSNRSINRERLQYERLTAELDDPNSLRHHVFARYRNLLLARAGSAAFAPQAPMRILSASPEIFAILRGNNDPDTIFPATTPDTDVVLCIHNFSNAEAEFCLDCSTVNVFYDIVQEEFVRPHRGKTGTCFYLEPHAVLWIKPYSEEPKVERDGNP